MTQNFLFQKYLQQILKCKVNLVKRETYWSGKHRISFHPRDSSSLLSSPLPATPSDEMSQWSGWLGIGFGPFRILICKTNDNFQLVVTCRQDSPAGGLVCQTTGEMMLPSPPSLTGLCWNPNIELSSVQISQPVDFLTISSNENK